MSTEENINIIRRAIEAFNTGDISKVSEFISEDYINRESQRAKDSYKSKLKGPEEFIDTIKNLRSAFPDLLKWDTAIAHLITIFYGANRKLYWRCF